jgi:hypothetical protein
VLDLTIGPNLCAKTAFGIGEIGASLIVRTVELEEILTERTII